MKTILTAEKIQKRSVSYEPINDIICKYTDNVETIINNDVVKTVSVGGVTTIEEILSLKGFDSITGKINVDWMSKGFGYIVGLLKESYNKVMQCELPVGYIVDGCAINDSYNPNKYIYCIWNNAAWQLADLNKKPINHPFFFDYCSSMVTDVNYDLDAVLKFMQDDQRFMPAKFKKDDELHIMEIPYYNADEYTGYHAIEFCFTPDNDEDLFTLTTGHSYDRTKYINKILEPFKLNDKNN